MGLAFFFAAKRSARFLLNGWKGVAGVQELQNGERASPGNEVSRSIFWSMVGFDSARVGNQQLRNLF
jgi:hypothetical protein